MKNIFIAWIRYQRRAASMQPFFNFTTHFLKPVFQQSKLKLFDYFFKGLQTFWLLCVNSPRVLWLQMPPTPLLNVALFYKLFNRKMIIVLDCHNGLFGHKWIKYVESGKYVNKADIIITHNHVIKEIALHAGINKEKLHVLETKPAYKKMVQLPAFTFDFKSPWIVMPCAFAEDEPLDIVFEAARKIPKITVVLTGNTNRLKDKSLLNNLPENVRLTGYLSTEDYEALFLNADAVLGLTTEKHVQLSVANEATGFEKPMVLSDTALLRELFGRGAVFIDTFNAAAMAAGIEEAIKNKEVLTEEVKILKQERNAKWNTQAENINEQINVLYTARFKAGIKEQLV